MRRALATVWTLVILAACSIPGKNLPSSDLFGMDKVFHLAAFLVFALLWFAAIRGTPVHRAKRAALLGALYAGATEIYQGLLPIGRVMDVRDIVANLAGVALGIAVALLIARLATLWKSERAGNLRRPGGS